MKVNRQRHVFGLDRAALFRKLYSWHHCCPVEEKQGGEEEGRILIKMRPRAFPHHKKDKEV